MQKIFMMASLFMMSAYSQTTDEFYNILALDGGGIRGLISSTVVLMIEEFSYKYAKSKGYEVPSYPGREGEGIISMKDMFDMTAGTSTGSIISAGLVYPSDKYKGVPKFFAKDIINIYSTRGGEIFS